MNSVFNGPGFLRQAKAGMLGGVSVSVRWCQVWL